MLRTGGSPAVLYLVSGRSASSSNPGRKIESIVATWQRMGINLKVFFGADLPGGVGDTAVSFGHTAHHQAWYRQSAVLRPGVHSWSEWRDLRHHRATVAALEAWLAEHPVDVIWERSSRLHWAGLVVAQRHGIPYVLEWKDNLIPYPISLLRWYALGIETRKCEGADTIVVESAVLRDRLTADGVERSKIIVAHNATDASEFTPDQAAGQLFREQHHIPAAATVVMYLGSYAFYHDTLCLVHAATRVGKGDEVPAEIVIVMIGDGRDRQRCMDAARKEPRSAAPIMFLDPIAKEAVPGALAAADIAVLPGCTDIICPIKIQEYMAMGLPTIAPDHACIREVITPDVDGLVFTPGDPQDLARVIRESARDVAARRRLGDAAAATVRDWFSWEATWGAAMTEVLQTASR